MTRLITIVVIALCYVGYSTSQERVRVDLFYETLCPYCKDYILKQIYPTFQYLKEYMTIMMVPYGNTVETIANGAYSFQCQHGQEECYMNMVQGCVLANQNIQDDVKINFIACVEGQDQPARAGELCANLLAISWDRVLTCIHGGEGPQIMHSYGIFTKFLNPPLAGVPTIVINLVRNATVESMARENLMQVVCLELKGARPPICQQYVPYVPTAWDMIQIPAY